MKKIIRLNESDLQRIVNRVIRETTNTKRGRRLYEGLEGDETVTLGDITINEGMTGEWSVSHNTLYVTLNDKAERSIDSMGNPASSITNNNNEERYGTTEMFWNVVCSTEDVRKGTLRDFPSYEERLHMNGISDPNLDESRRIRNKRRLYETELDRERYSLGDIRASFNGQSGNYVVKHSTLLLIDRNRDELHVFCDEVDEQSYR
jgi:hypothetical protein